MTEQLTQHGEPLWYKDAIIYELHVKSFCDSTGDGVGDFGGLIQKLDYLRELGVTALWLLPFYPSPLLDDGYDISDYFHIHPSYGTLSDFKRFLREAHRRGIRVITELVINHTSNQHRWFQRSRRSKPGSLWRDLYVWSDTTERYRDARIIFTDSESSNWAWDPVAKAYYWHRFYSHQPDLNYDDPRVRHLILRVLDYWFGMGVDGMRLDAVPYLFEREGTNCENLPETHAFLRELRAHVDAKFHDRMLLAEANQWPEDAAAYFGNGDECHMAFHFPIMPRLFMAVRMEDRFPIVDVLEQSLNIPPTCQWGMFLRNHDELTLEMVTDEERDYMYKAYARNRQARINVGIRRRLAPLLNNNRRLIELMNSLLLSLPGTPILYYGDEIGMGDNYHLGDRNGVRTPMQWTPDRNAGFSSANPQALFLPAISDPEYHFTTINVETQSGNLSSLLWFMRRIIAVRKRFKAFGQGRLEFLPSDNGKVLTYLRQNEDECILVVANLSRYCQAVHIQMPNHVGWRVREIFSDNRFPDVGEASYILTPGPHTFYWFLLEPPAEASRGESEKGFDIQVDVTWDRFLGSIQPGFIAALRAYIRRARWFGGKALTVRTLRVADHLVLRTRGGLVYLLLLEITYTSGGQESYTLPIGFASGDLQARILQEGPASVIAHLRLADQEGTVYEAVGDEEFHQALLQMILQGRSRRRDGNHLVVHRGGKLAALLGDKTAPIPSQLLKAEQSNTSIVYKDTFFLKLYRRVEEGVNPDVELPRSLTEATSFTQTPAYAGSLAWRRGSSSPVTIALLLQLVSNEGDAWSFTLDNIDNSLSHAMMLKGKLNVPLELPVSVLSVDPNAIPTTVQEFIGPVFIEMMSLLGQRTGELHLALGSLAQNPDVTPEPFSLLYQKSLYQSIRALVLKVFNDLERSLPSLDPTTAEAVKNVLANRKTILPQIRRIVNRKIEGMRIRTHGDYHLGQVLYTGKDFVVIDFEGEPARPLTERRLKQSALRDVAGMIRSFHYAAQTGSIVHAGKQGMDVEYIRHWADLWYYYVSGIYLYSYRKTVADSRIVPTDPADFALLLEAFILEKAVYELGYELNHRPDWLMIPARGIEQILRGGL
ncbi:MAG: maltose alpha-D-glucosyltransferase [Sedimentisphaerales bacterium]|nr:maltose alpha-D-glucosyltransferase [Sedimentisphaerales bacterium]